MQQLAIMYCQLIKCIIIVVRYMNNTLLTRSNLAKLGISSTSDCSFCLYPETFLHVVAGCNRYNLCQKSLGHPLINR